MAIRNAVIGVCLAVLVSGCATSPDRYDLEQQQMKVEQLRAQQADKLTAMKDQELQSQLDQVPDWVTQPPQIDAGGVYGVGIGDSDDLSVALDKARLKADYKLAQELKQQVSGLEQNYAEDATGSSTNQRYQAAIERFVAGVNMAGQEQVKQMVVVSGGKYHAYLLMRLSFAEMQKMLDQQSKMAGYNRMEAAFKELHDRVKEADAQKQQQESGVAGKEAEQVKKSNAVTPSAHKTDPQAKAGGAV